MEATTFTLVLWIWMGPRFEETRMLGLNRAKCVEAAIAIEADRWEKRIACIDSRGRVVFPGEPLRSPPVCANAACGWDLPGRRRV
jgi:hypothetical protein